MYVGCRGEGDGMRMMGVLRYGTGRDGMDWCDVMWEPFCALAAVRTSIC